ncbi:MAG: sulfatase [Verrucomicrobia bacterium]|nr:sulfatase [Verrucomicrobiota bacterium]
MSYKLNLLAPLAAFAVITSPAFATPPPNILVVYAEDISVELGSYGFAPVHTPNLDRLAAKGERFSAFFTVSPVCSASRSALFTGMYPTRIGAHNHRTTNPQVLPEPVRPLSHIFRDAGYKTLNFAGPRRDPVTGERLATGAAGSGKTDLNFLPGAQPFFDLSRVSWQDVPDEQPWIGWLTIQESHKGIGWTIARETLTSLVDPAEITLPPYWPDHPVARDEFANYLDAVSLMDRHFGEMWEQMKAAGKHENTIIVFVGDNGRCLFRDKQFLYDAGIHVPLIIYYPDGSRAGTVNDTLISGIDLPAMLLGLAGLPVPEWMEGRDMLAANAQARDYVIAARDRCDVSMDRIRAVRDERFKYIRNFMPSIPYMQWNPYKEREYPTWNLIIELKGKGRLNPTQLLFAAPFKPTEELYDLHNDPHEIHNLALDPTYAEVLALMRARLDNWLAQGPDHGSHFDDPLELFRNYFGEGRTPLDYGQFQPIAR